MTNRETTEPCPICDSQNTEVRFDRERHIKYLRRNHVIEGLEHTVCLECACSFNARGQIERNNQRFFEFEKLLLDGIIAPRKIVELRQTYNLTQEQAKNIFKTTGNLFSKWERGESAPSSAVSNLLEAALEDPLIMERFALRAGVRLAAKPPAKRPQKSEPERTVSSWINTQFPELILDQKVVDRVRVIRRHSQHHTPYETALHKHFAANALLTVRSTADFEFNDDSIIGDDVYMQTPDAYLISPLRRGQ